MIGRTTMERSLAAALALVVAAPALARTVSGKEFPESVEVGGSKLVLNGAGVRRKLFLKIYVGGLYLPSPSSDAAGIVAADAPKRVRLVFLRNVSRDDLKKAYRVGIERNSPGAQVDALVAKLDDLAAALPDVLREGSEMAVTYVPGEGTTIVTGDGVRATVQGKDFADAIFRTWLGDRPADGSLKDAMLGR
jgi:hypothetical protein